MASYMLPDADFTLAVNLLADPWVRLNFAHGACHLREWDTMTAEWVEYPLTRPWTKTNNHGVQSSGIPPSIPRKIGKVQRLIPVPHSYPLWSVPVLHSKGPWSVARDSSGEKH